MRRSRMKRSDLASSREEQRMIDLAMAASLADKSDPFKTQISDTLSERSDQSSAFSIKCEMDCPHYMDTSSTASSSKPSPAKKSRTSNMSDRSFSHISLKEQNAPQKINKHLAMPRSQRPETFGYENYTSRPRTEKLPEKGVIGASSGAPKLSTQQTLDWLHEVGNNTVAAYASKKISEASSAVKSDFGLLVGDLEENSASNLPSVDQVNFSMNFSSFADPLYTSQESTSFSLEKTSNSFEEGTSFKTASTTAESASNEKDSNDSKYSKSANEPHNKETDSDVNLINQAVEFVDQTSKKLGQHANTFLMETLIGTDHTRNNKIVEFRVLQREVSAFTEKRKQLEEMLKILDDDLRC